MLQVYNALRLRPGSQGEQTPAEIFVAASQSPSTAVCAMQLTVATLPLQPARDTANHCVLPKTHGASRDLGWAGTSHTYLRMRFAHPRIIVHLRTENAASWPLFELSKMSKSGPTGGQRARNAAQYPGCATTPLSHLIAQMPSISPPFSSF
jgi:hypothetical protein